MARSFLAEFLQGTAEASDAWPEVLQRQQALKAQEKANQDRIKRQEKQAQDLQDHRDRTAQIDVLGSKIGDLRKKRDQLLQWGESIREGRLPGMIDPETQTLLNDITEATGVLAQRIQSSSDTRDGLVGFTSPDMTFGTTPAPPVSDLMGGVGTPDLAGRPIDPSMPAYQGMATAPDISKPTAELTGPPTAVDVLSQMDALSARIIQWKGWDKVQNEFIERLEDAQTGGGSMGQAINSALTVAVNQGVELGSPDYMKLLKLAQGQLGTTVVSRQEIATHKRMAIDWAGKYGPAEGARLWLDAMAPLQDSVDINEIRGFYSTLLMAEDKYKLKTLSATARNDITEKEMQRAGAQQVIDKLESGVLDDTIGRVKQHRVAIFEFLNNPGNKNWEDDGSWFNALSSDEEAALANMRLFTEFMGRDLTGAAIQPFEREVFKAMFGAEGMVPEQIIVRLKELINFRAKEITAAYDVNFAITEGRGKPLDVERPEVDMSDEAHQDSFYDAPADSVDSIPATAADSLMGQRPPQLGTPPPPGEQIDFSQFR